MSRNFAKHGNAWSRTIDTVYIFIRKGLVFSMHELATVIYSSGQQHLLG